MNESINTADLNSWQGKLLKWLLILIGLTLMSAAIPLCFPFSLMARIHALLGMGELPAAPITAYLARSTALLYATHGVMMAAVGINLSRYLPLARLLGSLNLLFGIVMLMIDLTSGMPSWWTAIEGIPISIGGGVILWLASSVDRQRLR